MYIAKPLTASVLLARDAEKEAIHWSAVIKELVLRPPVAGGLVGVGALFLAFRCPSPMQRFSQPGTRQFGQTRNGW